jgi:hypothetical protein
VKAQSLTVSQGVIDGEGLQLLFVPSYAMCLLSACHGTDLGCNVFTTYQPCNFSIDFILKSETVFFS